MEGKKLKVAAAVRIKGREKEVAATKGSAKSGEKKGGITKRTGLSCHNLTRKNSGRKKIRHATRHGGEESERVGKVRKL